MSREKLTIRGAKNENEYDAMTRNASKTFGKDERIFRLMSSSSPGRKLSDTRVGILDGKIVCGLQALKRDIVIGGVSVQTGCVADVHVLPECQGRGFGLKLVEDVSRYMTARGDLFSYLCSDRHGFYGRHGWSAILRQNYVLDAAAPEFPVPARYVSKKIPLEQALGYLEMLAPEGNRGYSGYINRTAAYWKSMRDWYFLREPVCHAAFEKGKPVAVSLIRKDGQKMWIHECHSAAGHDESPKNLLREALLETKLAGRSELGGCVPEIHPVAVKIMLLGGRREPEDHLMGRIFDIEKFMFRMRPAFEKRLKIGGTFPDGVYRLKVTGSDAVDFKWSSGKLTVGKCSGATRETAGLDHSELVMRIIGVSGFHGKTYKKLPDFFETIVNTKDFVFWDTDRF